MIFALAIAIVAGTVDLIGQWHYDGFIFEEQRYPLPNPNLKVTFTFSEDNRVRLYWARDGEEGFCEREAQFEVNNSNLWQKIDWVNPDNAPDCQRDPDMQIGKESSTPLRLISKDELHFIFDLNGKEFSYILKRNHESGGSK